MVEEKDIIFENYRKVLDRIEKAASSVGRDLEEVSLVVVTKLRSVDTVKTLIDIGVKDIGENRVEEAVPKIMAVSGQTGVQWHMIGHVQSRKARQICEHFNLLHSLDRSKLANRLDRFAEEFQRVLPVLLQFNVSGEETKSGWTAYSEADWSELLPEMENIIQMENLEVRGLMTMAPFNQNPEAARPFFVRLRKLRDFLAKKFPQAGWDELSMGMSGDYEVGVQEGATIVRIGTAILGDRNY